MGLLARFPRRYLDRRLANSGLKAGILAKDIVVPDAAITNAVKFLDKVSSGSYKDVYGYTAPNGAPATALTAVGLLCRYYISKWGPGNVGLARGVEGLMKRPPMRPPAKAECTTTITRRRWCTSPTAPSGRTGTKGGLNKTTGRREGGMRDWLIELQDKKEGPALGSWEPDGAIIGGACGRVGTTSLALLTLEVYYRHLPLYKRDNAGGLRYWRG